MLKIGTMNMFFDRFGLRAYGYYAFSGGDVDQKLGYYTGTGFLKDNEREIDVYSHTYGLNVDALLSVIDYKMVSFLLSAGVGYEGNNSDFRIKQDINLVNSYHYASGSGNGFVGSLGVIASIYQIHQIEFALRYPFYNVNVVGLDPSWGIANKREGDLRITLGYNFVF